MLTSARCTTARPPRLAISPAVASAASREVLALITTAAPASASCRAIARPMFLALPVTMATAPSSSRVFSLMRSSSKQGRSGARDGKARRREAFDGERVRGQRRAVDLRHEAGIEVQRTVGEAQGLGEQAGLGLEEAVHLAGVADGRAGDAGFHPAADVGRHAVAEDRLHAELADPL